MLRRLALLFLLGGIALAQSAPAPSAAPKKPRKSAPAAGQAAAQPAAQLGPDSPVMFVRGLCALRAVNVPAKPVTAMPGTPPSQAGCVRAVTKAQFERMVEGLGARAANADKAQLAEYYARALVIDNEARKLKLDQDPAVAQAIWMGRIGALGDALHRHMQLQFGNLPDAEIAKYYDEHKQDFEEVTVRRVVIPKPPQKTEEAKPEEKKAEAAASPDSPSAAKAAAPAAAPQVPYEQIAAARKTYADKVLARAKAGEDLDKLQKEAFTSAQIEAAAPDTNPVPLHRGQLPPAHDEKVFPLQPGQYSVMIEEPNAYLFYKVEKKRAVPMAEVATDIRRELVNRKEDAAIQAIFAKGEPSLNPAYFAQPRPQAPGAPEGAEQPAPPEGAKPPAAAEPQPQQPPAEAPKEPATAEPPKQESAPPPAAEPPKQPAASEPPK
jgi:hypothetical protein